MRKGRNWKRIRAAEHAGGKPVWETNLSGTAGTSGTSLLLCPSVLVSPFPGPTRSMARQNILFLKRSQTDRTLPLTASVSILVVPQRCQTSPQTFATYCRNVHCIFESTHWPCPCIPTNWIVFVYKHVIRYFTTQDAR